MKKLFFVLMLLPILLSAVNPESEMQVEQAWQAWQINDLTSVEEHFQTAIDLDETRKYPYERWSYTDHYFEEIAITLPGGRQPVDLQESSEFECFAGKYSRQLKFEGGVLKCARILDVFQKDIPPEKYLEFKEFYSNLVKADEMQILLEQK
ncbi:MAG: hypothetical protein Q7J16_08400 [Candidatus Cloacimonadales bacterium]|nr:hypothetical protein [Candidatus Cloacimonadales bacterium]